MPTPISLKQIGPVANAGGKVVYLVEEVTAIAWEIVENPLPNLNADHVGPECWERREWERRNVQKETYYVHEYAAKEKTNVLFWVGVALLVVAAVATGGAAVVAYGVTAATAAVVGVQSAVLLGVAGIAGAGGYNFVQNPNEYEIDSASKLGSTGPHVREINWHPLPPRVEQRAIPCPETTGTTTTGPGTGTGTGTGH